MRNGPEKATAQFRFWVATENFGPVSRQWPSVATGIGLGWAFLGCDKGVLGRDRASWLYVAT